MKEQTQKLRLVLVTDRKILPPGGLLPAVESALAGGAGAVMLRENDLPEDEMRELAAVLREATRRGGALLIVNHRSDLAAAVGADGVHLGWRSGPVERARAIVGPDLLIGVSTHSAEEAMRAEETGADYVTFGPVFPTPSKTGLVDVQGIAGVRRVRQAGLGIPLVGIGGIDAANAASVFEAGAEGVAAIRALLAAPDPGAVARRILEAADEAG